MKIKKLTPVDAESRRLIDWMEKGVYDALQKKYLRTLLFCICETVDGPMIEEYAFSFSYSNADSQEVSMNINRTGNKKQGGTFKYNSTNEVTPTQMKSSACKMIRTLIQLMRTLDKMPEERTILMKLLYYDDVTPADYEPPFFRGCSDEETRTPWMKNPLKMEVGNVNSKHFVLALKVKSVLDPCEDDNEENQDPSVSLGADSVQGDDSSESGCEVNSSQENRYIVAPVDQQPTHQEDTIISQRSDDTQDPAEDELQLTRVKDWIESGQHATLEIADVFAKFPDISAVLMEEIVGKLTQEGLLCKSGRDAYAISNQKDLEYQFDVKEELDDQVPPNDNRAAPASGHDYMYMKALYHALPMEYVTAAELQRKLEGQAEQSTVRKLIDKMTKDGFLEATSNRKRGKRVVHSDKAEKKLREVRKALEVEAMDVGVDVPQNQLNHDESEKAGRMKADVSTCGVLQSIGSDLTRMQVRSHSEMHQNGSLRTDQSVPMTREVPETPADRAVMAASRESTWLGDGKSRSNGHNMNGNGVDDVICSRPSQDKRCRKASMVKEPIIQWFKRQKSQAV